ncbi:MAG: DEAD/DEAH box helicase [Planctomycetota bacterium]
MNLDDLMDLSEEDGPVTEIVDAEQVTTGEDQETLETEAIQTPPSPEVPTDALVEASNEAPTEAATEPPTEAPTESKKAKRRRKRAEAAAAAAEQAGQDSTQPPPKEDQATSEEVPTKTFRDLGLDPQVVQAVEQSGYTTPTSVQEQVIPSVLAGRDVLAQSQTGSGKTAAFALPILSKLDSKPGRVQTLVLAPTRELAIQVAESFEKYAEHVGNFRVLAIYGGQDYEHQFRSLKRGVNVVVGTPGRVIDHIKRGTLDLSELQCLVLDEADEMLNMGFLEDVEFVLKQTPDNRQVTLFSATMPDAIRRIADTYLVDPDRVTIKRKQVTAESIVQRAVIVSPKSKVMALSRFLEVEPTDGVIVFTKTKEATIRVSEQLVRNGFASTALNGDMPQKVRERAIEQLKDGQLDILVATDVAARGLDVTRVSHVFNFDLPHDSESYIHRIGRTGRAGREGHAIIFLTPAQRRKLRLIEKATRQSIEVVPIPKADDINATRVTRFKESLTKTIAERDLSFFQKLVQEYAEESGQPIERIAAALAELGQKGRPFLVNDRRDFNSDESPRSAGGHDGKQRGNRDGEPRKRVGPPEAGMTRYRIEVGRDDGVAPRNIVGAVANEAGIQSEFIGPIQIFPHFSTIDLPEGMPKDVFQTLQRAWVSGKQLRIRPDQGPGGGRSGGRPGGGGRSKPRYHSGKKRFGKPKKR